MVLSERVLSSFESVSTVGDLIRDLPVRVMETTADANLIGS